MLEEAWLVLRKEGRGIGGNGKRGWWKDRCLRGCLVTGDAFDDMEGGTIASSDNKDEVDTTLVCDTRLCMFACDAALRRTLGCGDIRWGLLAEGEFVFDVLAHRGGNNLYENNSAEVYKKRPI